MNKKGQLVYLNPPDYRITLSQQLAQRPVQQTSCCLSPKVYDKLKKVIYKKGNGLTRMEIIGVLELLKTHFIQQETDDK